MGERDAKRRKLDACQTARLTFLYCEENLGLAIPPLEVEVAAGKPRRKARKPVPAPKPVGAAPRTATPAAVYP